MKLKRLDIQLQTYGQHKDKYLANVEYEAGGGELKYILEPSATEALLIFIGPVITQFAHGAALQLEKNILASVNEAQKAPTIQLADQSPAV